ncbi:phage portal protein [Bradyrhizobium sp. SRL28]|uniref:phage portal protein n=1 Tax=Bradyrhizobium sp. SRL28 TaxID=2836178 RepID=UPI001BDF16C7|nr:phage portal protein [Bradyrhizobium sp. SRL28]MBT1509416.1 phage portal protein [Bradyrhizobium sp. SRL28]
MANFLQRIIRPFLKGEGEWHNGPYQLPVTGGWLPAGSPWNFWQSGIEPIGGDSSAMVEACLSAYSQTVAMCPGDHWRMNDKNGRDRVTNSALSRILRYPNSYQSPSDFMLNATRWLYYEGNAYALALRNDRFEIDELHLMDSRLSAPQIASTGDIFYRLAGNDVIDKQVREQLIVPARDVLHIRLHASRRRIPYPLVGDTPLGSALQDIMQSNAMTAQQINFYMNQARPSAVLTTDLILDKDQVQFIRDRWDEQSKGLRAGGTPILTAGLKPMMLASNSKDSDLAEVMKLTEQRIALAFRIPLQILGLGGTTMGSTEALMLQWVASGLGFALNHIEDAYGLLFNLKGQPDEYVEFDTKALLRSAFKERIAGLAQAVQGGIFSPNEARASESLDEVEYGDEPRVQQQVVPLSAAAGIPSAPGMPGAPPQPGMLALPKPAEKPPEDKPTSAKDYSDVVATELRTILARADHYDRSNA